MALQKPALASNTVPSSSAATATVMMVAASKVPFSLKRNIRAGTRMNSSTIPIIVAVGISLDDSLRRPTSPLDIMLSVARGQMPRHSAGAIRKEAGNIGISTFHSTLSITSGRTTSPAISIAVAATLIT